MRHAHRNNFFKFFSSNYSDIWKLGDYCREKQSEYRSKGIYTLSNSPSAGLHTPIDILLSREQSFNEQNIINERVRYKRYFFDMATLPKVILHGYCGKNKIPQPIYDCRRVDRQFYCIVTVQDKQYTSVFWSRDARYAEQAAALVCCFHLGLYQENFLVSIGCLYKR